jgi:hypothetical protein
VPQVDTKAKFDIQTSVPVFKKKVNPETSAYLSNVLVFVLQQGIDSFAFETIL